MSVRMYCDRVEVLHCRGSVFAILYQALESIIEADDILNERVIFLMEKLEACSYGVVLDFADYLKNKSDALEFVNLVSKAIVELEKSKSLPDDIKNIFKNFFNALNECAFNQ